jgi:hypothetical protein
MPFFGVVFWDLTSFAWDVATCAQWLNTALSEMWPFYDAAISSMVKVSACKGSIDSVAP